MLDCALKQVLGAGEREPKVPMECEEKEPQEEQEKMEISMDSMKNFKFFGNLQEFNVETTLTYPDIDSKSEVRQGDNMEMEKIENQNLDPSRPPELDEMESKGLTSAFNFY